MTGFYNYVKQLWKKPKETMKPLVRERLIEWRKQERFVKLEKPTRIDKARELGYKSKKGYVIVRARIERGGRSRPLYGRRGRKPSKSGVRGFSPIKSLQAIVEERVSKKYPNMEILNSYAVGQDGQHKWFEVILVDPNEPQIKSDKRINWVCDRKNKGRAHRGLTAAGKRARQ